jgi:pimeloyl-ACP methyl ester carboxylesterase
MMRFALLLLVILSLVEPVFADQPRGIRTEITRVSVIIDGEIFELEVFFAAPKGDGPYPVALLTHGSAGDLMRPEDIRAESELGYWASNFAHRGYLAVAVMRRGYGLSDGSVVDEDGSCADPDPDKYLQAQADDLEAVLKAIASRKDADMSRIVGIGQSVGGAAMLALSARKAYPLSAIISVSGGLYHWEGTDGVMPFDAFGNCGKYEQALIRAIGEYAQGSKVQALWLYAENDPYFPPSLVSQMQDSWKKNGGSVVVGMFPPNLIDGHRIFFENRGRSLLLPAIDKFLRSVGLPTWDAKSFEKLRASLPVLQQQYLDEYLEKVGTEKALAVPETDEPKLSFRYGEMTIDRAKRMALSNCENYTGKKCKIIAENFEIVP